MSNKRPVILMAVLLAALAGYFTQPWWNPNVPHPLAPLPGKNTLTGLKVAQDAQGEWFADYDYFYTGTPQVQILMQALDSPSAPLASAGTFSSGVHWLPWVERGAHHAHVAVPPPGTDQATSTGAIEVRMVAWPDGVVARQRVAQRIDWPDWPTRALQAELSGRSDDTVVKTAAGLIDQGSGEALEHARQLLERVLARNPKEDAAYVELARVAMKTNWGPEGLHQAETLIDSALQIRPDGTNARVLLAYVESHQKRYPEAEALFEKLDKENPPNLWLWWNWGEMLQAQGKRQPAIQKFRQALAHPVTHDTYDRARLSAYDSLVDELGVQGDLDGLEALYKQRLADYGAGGCSATLYARFLVTGRGDAAAAIDMARKALQAPCDDGGPPARATLGMAYYLTWAASMAADRGEALNQARVYLPVGAQALYLLASNERTLPAARALTRQGEPIDQRDNQRMDALALALSHHDLAAARHLIALGARPDALVGAQDMPVAFVPVAAEDKAGIRLMQQSGIDYATLRFRGATAIELARRAGRPDLAEWLDAKGHSL